MAALLVVASVGAAALGVQAIRHALRPIPPIAMSFPDSTLGPLEVFAPHGRDSDTVVVLMDTGVQPHPAKAAARQLAEEGAIAIRFDYAGWRKAFAAEPPDTDNCYYLADAFKDAAQEVERGLGMKRYVLPVVAALQPETTALALGVLGQAPINTIAGVVGLSFGDRVRLDRPFCQGLALEPQPDGSGRLAVPDALPSPLRIVAADAAAPARWIEHAVARGADAEIVTASPDEMVPTGEPFLDAVFEVGSLGGHADEELPVTILKPRGPAVALAVFVSGDGGWRDIDQSIAGWLVDHGVAVLGLDALRYFWSEKRPDRIATDIARLLDDHADMAPGAPLALMGFSFGADIVPFAWRHLPAELQRRVALIGLVSPGRSATFSITAAGYLGLDSTDSKDSRKVLGELPMERTLCVHGSEEAADDSTGCTLPALAAAERMERPGGHHLDGDYAFVARRMLERLVPTSARETDERHTQGPEASER